jgi:hypothetical protein
MAAQFRVAVDVVRQLQGDAIGGGQGFFQHQRGGVKLTFSFDIDGFEVQVAVEDDQVGIAAGRQASARVSPR